jgi:cytoskeletal protein RodZ
MVNNKGLAIAIVIIIVIVIAGVYLAAQNTGSGNNTSNVSNNTPQNVSQQNNTTLGNATNSTSLTNSTNTTNNQTAISAQQAQKIAQVYILESGARAGNPVLSKWPDERLVWHVPIINSNGQPEGIGIDIDAQTGANLGES